MSFSEKCRKCSVKVDEGSGVLFQPMTEDYSYILTAKHNLEDGGQLKNKEDITIISSGYTINIIEIYRHSSLDIAIVKINKIDFDSPIRYIKHLLIRDKYLLYGYPSLRNDNNENQNLSSEIMSFDITVIDIADNYVVVRNSEDYEQREMMGCSGGGIFTNDDGFYLAGVEYEMDSSSQEHNRRLRFIPIEKFVEIINENASELMPLYPPYMNDFNLLVDNIYILNNCQFKREFVRSRIKYLSRNYARGVTPIEIYDEFKNKILINGFNINHITSSQLWQMYLEFILLSIIVDNKECLSLDKIKDIYKKRKILFAKSKSWTALAEDILKSDLRGLQKNSVVFIACVDDNHPFIVELSSQSIIDISQPPQKEEMMIDQSIDYTIDIKYKHVFAIEQQLLKSQDEFVVATPSNIDEILKRVLQNVC